MIRINFVEPTDDEWKDWRKECKNAQEKLNKSYATGSPEDVCDLYKKLRHVFFSPDGPFFGKCAYCESQISTTHPGDVDHFRPKGQIRDHESGQFIMIKGSDGKPRKHPGYYWLAYDWENLLPACEYCNRIHGNVIPDKNIGKWDRFPLKAEATRKCEPGPSDDEAPLLLKPTDPSLIVEDHLVFDEKGIIAWKTEEGRTTVEILGLNRQSLVEARARAYRESRNLLLAFITSLIQNCPDSDEHRNDCVTIEMGSVAYAAVRRLAIKMAWSRVEGARPSDPG